jgi:hypothetical protein
VTRGPLRYARSDTGPLWYARSDTGPLWYARSDTGPIWHARRINKCLKRNVMSNDDFSLMKEVRNEIINHLSCVVETQRVNLDLDLCELLG